MCSNTKYDVPSGEVESYFGGCPICGKTDGCIIICHPCSHADAWFICNAHACMWDPCVIGEQRAEPPVEDWYEANRIAPNADFTNVRGFTWVMPIRFLRDRQHKLPELDGIEP